MRVLHITFPSAHLRRTGNRLEVWVKKERVDVVQMHGLQQLVLAGNVAVSPAAMDLLLRSGVDTVFLTGSGRYRGRLVGQESSNIRLRLRQFEQLTQPAIAVQLAKQIVRGKIRNQREHLLRHRRRRSERTDHPRIGQAVRALRAATLRVDLAEDLDEVRGCEGSASAAYFRVFGEIITNPDFSFSGRSRRPPMDPVNALLSLGYTLLFNLTHAAVVRVGLDPYLGALHAPTAGRPSLVCDLVEEMRAPVVDALVVGALNRHAFSLHDFEDQGPGEPVLMKRETMRWMVHLFERRVERLARYAPYDQRLPFHQIIEHQARRLARTLTEGVPYEPYAMP